MVLAIITLIGGIGAGTYQAARRNYSLVASAGRIQGLLRAARNTSLATGIPSFVVVDPVSHTVTAQAFERVGEWSFDVGEPSVLGPASARINGATAVSGVVGQGLRFNAPGAYVDCGAEARFDLRTAIQIEAWVRHLAVRDVAPPRIDGARRPRPRRLQDEVEPADVIVEKAGAYFLGMAHDGSLEGAVGNFRVRTAPDVVTPGRWVRVSMRFDGNDLELSADGIPRRAVPVSGGAGALRGQKVTLPATGPVTTSPLTISSPGLPFPGDMDEVSLSGTVEPLIYRYADHEHVPGWKKIVHFDRQGHLDPRFHPEAVRIALLDLGDKEQESATKTTVVVDLSLTFDEWLARWDEPPPLRQSEEEAKLEARYATSRKIVIEVDRLGVVK